MTSIESFVNRLKKIGVHVELSMNYPWVYLKKVNGRQVSGNFQGSHGFTVFFKSIKIGRPDSITDIGVIFNKIRETIK